MTDSARNDEILKNTKLSEASSPTKRPISAISEEAAADPLGFLQKTALSVQVKETDTLYRLVHRRFRLRALRAAYALALEGKRELCISARDDHFLWLFQFVAEHLKHPSYDLEETNKALTKGFGCPTRIEFFDGNLNVLQSFYLVITWPRKE